MTATSGLPPDAPLSIDVVSDVVCPWCFIGKRRLEAGLRLSGDPAAIRWRPFQLDPTIPREGLNRHDYLMRKFGDAGKVEAIHARIAAAGAEAGIAFAFDRIERSPNTLDAHRLIRWAAATDSQEPVVEALFQAYFVEGRDIGAADTLVDIAARCGMDATLVRNLLAGDKDAADVHAEIATAVRLGVSGVPFFIFAGRYAVSGAQSAEVLAAALAKARAAEPVAATA